MSYIRRNNRKNFFSVSPYLNIMLSQEELAFIKAISTLQLFPALLKELRMALSSRRKKKPVVSAGSHSTAPGGGFKASQRPSGK